MLNKLSLLLSSSLLVIACSASTDAIDLPAVDVAPGAVEPAACRRCTPPST
jgi:hypothetical protein